MAESIFSVVRVGVSVILYNKTSTEILLGYRLSEHGRDTWSFPGGHIELFASPEDTVYQELAEEIGSQCKLAYLTRFHNFPWESTIFPSGKHYITLFFQARLESGEPIVMEPDKCREWKWFKPYSLPSPLFGAMDKIKHYL